MPRDAGPIAVMLREHQVGRGFVGQMKKALPEAREGNPDARKILVNAGRGYIQLIRGHIQKEDNVLFHMADQLVTGGACDKLCERYGVVCRGALAALPDPGRSARNPPPSPGWSR